MCVNSWTGCHVRNKVELSGTWESSPSERKCERMKPPRPNRPKWFETSLYKEQNAGLCIVSLSFSLPPPQPAYPPQHKTNPLLQQLEGEIKAFFAFNPLKHWLLCWARRCARLLLLRFISLVYAQRAAPGLCIGHRRVSVCCLAAQYRIRQPDFHLTSFL